ncbi:MAG: hypothetical protein ACXACP_01040 [Candidatus Hodarchaeales archaeon]|jgi:hypothetical protein
MDDIQTDIAQCNGCGAPLLGKPTFHKPIQCEYCDLTNYLKKSLISDSGSDVFDEESESEHQYLVYQESQKILENFPGELVGDEVGKVRIKMQVDRYAFPLLIVLDDLPDKPYIDGPNKLREILDCELTELNLMKNWIPGTTSVLDVLEEIYDRAKKGFPQKMDKPSPAIKNETKRAPIEKDPLLRQILLNYDSNPLKKAVEINFYAQTGEVIKLTIKRKKNYPIGLENEVLTRYPLIRGPLEDYAKGRIDLLATLAEIERLFYV